ncbi:MAG: DNA polymerase III subunit gamma/tau, partial [Bartonella sp.]|nr:DNA polymerase III subunit gamma/tau [Bartonella sp.]
LTIVENSSHQKSTSENNTTKVAAVDAHPFLRVSNAPTNQADLKTPSKNQLDQSLQSEDSLKVHTAKSTHSPEIKDVLEISPSVTYSENIE